MKLSPTEISILEALKKCRLAGAFESRLIHINRYAPSPRNRWQIYHYGYKYRDQIRDDELLSVCMEYLRQNPVPPPRKRTTEQVIRKAFKPELNGKVIG